MTNSDRKKPEYLGLSVSYQSDHDRGWRKKNDRYYHHKDRKQLQESITHDIPVPVRNKKKHEKQTFNSCPFGCCMCHGCRGCGVAF